MNFQGASLSDYLFSILLPSASITLENMLKELIFSPGNLLQQRLREKRGDTRVSRWPCTRQPAPGVQFASRRKSFKEKKSRLYAPTSNVAMQDDDGLAVCDLVTLGKPLQDCYESSLGKEREKERGFRREI